MHGYYMSIGYISGATCAENKEDAWPILKQVVMDLCGKTDEIIREAMAFMAPTSCNGYSIEEHAEAYKGNQGKIIKYYEGGDADDGPEQCVSFLCGATDALKEHVRRAFCRLVLYEMHRRGIEVNLEVI